MAGGIGRAAALLFASEGAQVVGCDLKDAEARETEALGRADGGQITVLGGVDLGDETAARGWVNDAAQVYGGIDIVYNNAGAFRIGRSIKRRSRAGASR